MGDTFSIGQASKITGIPAKTIRYYEEINLLKPAKRLKNSYRSYSQSDLNILLLIKESKSLGLPLVDINSIIHLCLSNGCESANAFLKAKVPALLEEIEIKMNELKDLKNRLLDYKPSPDRNQTDNCCICSMFTKTDKKEVV